MSQQYTHLQFDLNRFSELLRTAEESLQEVRSLLNASQVTDLATTDTPAPAPTEDAACH